MVLSEEVRRQGHGQAEHCDHKALERARERAKHWLPPSRLGGDKASSTLVYDISPNMHIH
jgi:hypothetical protein